MTRLLSIIVLAVSGSYAVAQQDVIAPAEAIEQHAQAVALARDARFDEAISILDSLHRDHPSATLFLLDLAATLSWAEKDQEALELAPSIDFTTAPTYVVHAVAKSARNVRDYASAVDLYSIARDRDGADIDAQVGLAMALAESGEHARADAVFAALPAELRSDPSVLAAQAYIERLAGRLIAALHAYDRSLEQSPNDTQALRGKALVLRDLLLPAQALELAQAHRGILTDAEMDRLKVDELALQLRLAANTVYPEEMDGQLLELTISAIDDHLAVARSDDVVLALRYDRIAALAERNHAAEAVTSFEALETPFEELPAYVLAAAGKAYLQLERPARALRLLERAVMLPPVDIETRFALIFAYLDLDRYEEAMVAAEAAIAQQPLLVQSTNALVVHGNENGVRAEIMAALAESSIDRLKLAQLRLESLLADAPNNSDLRHELANVYRLRGWLDGAIYEYDQVLTMNEDLVYAQVGKAHTQLDAQRYREVQETIESLTRVESPDPIVEQLAERWQLHNRSELLVEAARSDSSGTTFGSNQYTIDTSWFTRPIRYHHRAFVHVHSAFAEFPEGDARRRRFGVGSEYRADRWSARGEILHDRDTHSNGFAGVMAWRISDQWRLSGTAEIDSQQAQLRAHRLGIEADFLSISAEYAAHESSYYRFGVDRLDYTDQNTRQSVFGALVRRVATRPRSITSITANVSTSRNSVQTVPYFAPRSDASLVVGGRHEWRVRRRYDRLLLQRTSLEVGSYRQSGYASGSLWRLGYSLEYRVSDALNLEVGAQRARNFFDGAPEHDTSVFATISARLGR